METINVAKKERVQLRRLFSKTYNELVVLIYEKEPTELTYIEDIRSCFNKLEDKSKRLFLIDDKVKQLLFSQEEDIKDEELDNEFDTVEEYRDKWFSIKAKCE